jgi:ribosomal protein S18 acetylase RimI-like enzyme
MEIKTLDEVSVAVIANAFNEAFSDYKIKFTVTEESFRKKFEAEAIRPEGSAGAFDNGRLVGFILHGMDEIDGQKQIFNAGTGVIPQYRGQGLTEKMYKYIVPLLAEQGYRHHQLEVLHDNLTAKRIYERMGFKDVRMVASFMGPVPAVNIPGVTVTEVDAIDWAVAETFRTVEPTWQNNTRCLLRSMDRNRLFAGYINGEFAGYAAFDTLSGRLKQFAVKPELRRKGVGRALFGEVGKLGDINIVNYDLSDTDSIAFFKALGLEQDFELYEMKMQY